MPKDFNEWRARCLAMIDLIYPLIKAAHADRKALESDFAEWRKPRDAAPEDYLKHDARLEYFNSLRVTLENAQIAYTNMHDNLTRPEWYRAKNQVLSEDKIHSILKEHAIMVKWFTFHSCAMTCEDCFRSIVRAAKGAVPADPTGDFKALHDELLNFVGLQGLIPLFDTIRLARNTIHNNGRYIRGSCTIKYRDREFEFRKGEILAWLTEECVIWLLSQLEKAMLDIVRSEPVAGIAYCPRG